MLRKTDVLILAGGKGTRLRTVVSDRPKPMAEVAGQPFLAWLVRWLKSQGVQRIICCTGYMSDVISTYFGDGSQWGVEMLYSAESEPLGTGGAIRLALPLVQSERFLAINGDSFCHADLGALLAAHSQNQALATLLLTPVEDCRRYGAVVVDTDGQIQAFQEKSPELQSGLVNAGIYVLERATVAAIPAHQPCSLETEFFQQLIGKGLYGFVGAGELLDIGTPESYMTAEQFLAAQQVI